METDMILSSSSARNHFFKPIQNRQKGYMQWRVILPALTGKEIVYDLYCGTGSIGIFVSPLAKKDHWG